MNIERCICYSPLCNKANISAVGEDFSFNFTTCSTLINFLSFAQLSLISKKMSALTLSLPFSKIECAPDHHSFKKSALVFQSFSFSNIQ